MNGDEISLKEYLVTTYGQMAYHQIKPEYEEELTEKIRGLQSKGEMHLSYSVLEWGFTFSGILSGLPKEAFIEGAIVCPDCESRMIGRIEYIDRHYSLYRKDFVYYCMACVGIDKQGACLFNLGKLLINSDPKRAINRWRRR